MRSAAGDDVGSAAVVPLSRESNQVCNQSLKSFHMHCDTAIWPTWVDRKAKFNSWEATLMQALGAQPPPPSSGLSVAPLSRIRFKLCGWYGATAICHVCEHALPNWHVLHAFGVHPDQEARKRRRRMQHLRFNLHFTCAKTRQPQTLRQTKAQLLVALHFGNATKCVNMVLSIVTNEVALLE